MRKTGGKRPSRSRSRSWHEEAPLLSSERYRDLRVCGASCFGEPRSRPPKYPVCVKNSRSCRPVKEGCAAARSRAAGLLGKTSSPQRISKLKALLRRLDRLCAGL